MSSDEMAARNMSYTNLADMASNFETYQRRPQPAAPRMGAGSGPIDPDALHAQAQELIAEGLKVDLSAPVAAVELYSKGADLLSQALEVAPPDERSERMQRTLDMVEERVRFISREKLGRSMSDSQACACRHQPCAKWSSSAEPRPVVQVSTAMPPSPGSDLDASLDAMTVLERERGPGRAFNFFDLALPEVPSPQEGLMSERAPLARSQQHWENGSSALITPPCRHHGHCHYPSRFHAHRHRHSPSSSPPSHRHCRRACAPQYAHSAPSSTGWVSSSGSKPLRSKTKPSTLCFC